jgi:hypothetical protein
MKKIFLWLSIIALTSCEKREEIHLERIVYHTSTSFLGTNPSYHLAINRNRIASLIVEQAFKNSEKFPTIDSTKIGHYIGKIDEKKFKALERELYRINIMKLQLEDLLITDISQKSIIIYLNGKKIKIDKTYRSKDLNHLVNILESIYEDGSFTKINQQLEIEE